MTLISAYVAFAGCGDEETPPATTTDAGNETSTVDTYKPPVDATVDSRSPEYTGSACKVATDCYRDLQMSSSADAGDGGDASSTALKGDPVCIDKVTDGYCTHKCQTDADCCAVPGECRTGLKQVCASFENSPDKYCFLSCEDADIASATDAGASDAGSDGDQYCQKNANPEFGCRSTGGGTENRKVCFPVGPATDGGGKKDSGADAGDGGDGGDGG